MPTKDGYSVSMHFSMHFLCTSLLSQTNRAHRSNEIRRYAVTDEVTETMQY